MIEKSRALLASARIANAPSAVSNAVLGFLLGKMFWGVTGGPDWLFLGLLAGIAASLLVMGNLANDWHDRDWDARHRPERALPAGLFCPTTYLIMIVGFALLALIPVWWLGTGPFVVTLLIMLCIGLYTWLHKRSQWSVLAMGLCRAGLYVLGFACAWPHDLASHSAIGLNFPGSAYSFYPWVKSDVWLAIIFISLPALGMLSYVAGLSLTARYESLPNPPVGSKRLAKAMLWFPLLAVSAWWIPFQSMAAGLALIPLAVWLGLALTIFRRPVSRMVSALLAGIALVDLIAALPLAMAWQSSGGDQFSLALIAVCVPIAAFVSGLALQKIAPAT